MQLPDWYKNYVGGGAEGAINPFMQMTPPGVQSMQQPALTGPPQALLNAAFGAPSSTSGGLQQGNPGPDASAFAPRPPSAAPAAPQVASAPAPTPRPPQSAFSAYNDATAPAGGLASDPSTWKSAAGDGGLGYVPGGGAGDGGLYAQGTAPGGATMGPGSWMPDMSKMGNFVDKNSVIGKLLSMSNPSAAPAGSAAAGGGQQAEAILPKLFQMFMA